MSQRNYIDMFKDLRVRVIYYSCLAEPKNILEISKLWEYKTSTYFYQKNSRKIIDEMISKDIVSTLEGARFQSNYDLFVEEKGIRDFFRKTNQKVTNAIIEEKYDYEITESQLEDRLFREFCIEKKPELKTILKEVEITNQEVEKFISLWKTLLFRKIFLSADCIKRLIGERQYLPQDPRELLFTITIDTCEKLYFFNEGGIPDFPNPYLWVNIDEIFPSITGKLESAKSSLKEESHIFSQSFKDLYKILKGKFKVYEGRSEISAYHVAKFINLVGI